MEQQVGMLEWAGLGAIMFALVIFCARIMRRGLTTLDDDRKQNKERIAEGMRRLDEDRKNISASEQLYLAEAAMHDLIRLERRVQECRIEADGNIIELRTPDSSWQVELLMHESALRSRHKILHGQSRWLLRGEEINESHREISSLMASIAGHLHGKREEGLPPHLARRLAAQKPGCNRRSFIQEPLNNQRDRSMRE